jgi:hypothetical protein
MHITMVIGLEGLINYCSFSSSSPLNTSIFASLVYRVTKEANIDVLRGEEDENEQ